MDDVVDIAAEDLTAVIGLLRVAAAHDGAEALSEAGELAIRHRRPGVRHLGVRSPELGGLAGYAQVTTSGDGVASVEGAVHPDERRRGVGTALATAVTAAAPAGFLAWAHGGHPGATALAERMSAEPVRELIQMRRPLAPEDSTSQPVIAGVQVRGFEPGRDEEAWLRVNAAAFADHPEQGATTAADLRERMAEPWFDPAGFLLAVDAETGELLGFHWTKVHPATDNDPARGEVYVLGVAPQAQGRRLGTALARAGLAHLASTASDGAPLEAVILYVEGDNTAALRLYHGLGFARSRVDVQYRWPSRSADTAQSAPMSH